MTLRIGTDDDPGRPGGAQIQEFARQVQQRSNGQVRIEPVWQAAGEGADDWDQVVARKVVHGELDMGMVPARAWDTEGVTSLRALHAPFLVTSDELVGGIVKGELAPEMLAGLEKIGVTGLALLPEGLRHVFAFGDPPLSPADFDGMGIRAPTSKTTYAAFEALGAKPDDFGGSGDRFAEGIKKGQIGGAESSFALAGTLPARTAAVGNLTFFPKVNSLVINTKVFKDLTEDQRAILRDAAQRTVDWAIGSNPERRRGGQGVLHQRRPDRPRQRGGHREVPAGRPTRLPAARAGCAHKGDDRADPVAERGGRSRPDGGQAVRARGRRPGNPQGEAGKAFPEGVYRMEMPEEFLVQAGVDRPNRPQPRRDLDADVQGRHVLGRSRR